MEEAYSELYQEFLRLRSLCMRQAALLHELTTALQKQQVATVPNGETGDLIHKPVQCTQEIPTCHHEKPPTLTATAQNPAVQCGIGHLPRNMGAFSDLLAEDMSKLCVDGLPQSKETRESEQNKTPMQSHDLSKWHTASSSVTKNYLQVDPLGGDKTMHAVRMPGTDRSLLAGNFLSLSDSDMLVSDVVLQSHICEFCQAVFPENTTTRGEFLRHLYTHVT